MGYLIRLVTEGEWERRGSVIQGLEILFNAMGSGLV